jgi:hypothetical protein
MYIPTPTNGSLSQREQRVRVRVRENVEKLL